MINARKPPLPCRFPAGTPAALAVGLVVLAFLPILHNGFVWDDEIFFVKNHAICGLDPRRLRWMFSTFLMGQYRPLSWMLAAASHMLWGGGPFGFHLSNLLVHAANTLVFYHVAKRLLALALGCGVGDYDLRLGAAGAAAFFGMHPLRVESVAWASNGHALQASFFTLLTLFCYIEAQTMACARQRRRAWRILSLTCYLLSLLCKPSGVAVPAALLALDFYPLRRLAGANRFKSVLWEKAPYLLMAGAAAVVAVRAESASGNLWPLAAHGISARLAQAIVGFGFYLRKTIMPGNLSPLYPVPRRFGLLDGQVRAGLATLFIAGLGLRAAGLPRPARIVLWSCYAAFLLPVLGILQNGPQLVAARYSYDACLGWAVLAGAGLVRLRRAARAGVISRRLAALGWAGLALLALATRTQTAVWQDDVALWSRAVQALPACAEVRFNLASVLMRDGSTSAAILQLQEAARLEPGNAAIWLRLGHAQAQSEAWPQAAACYARTLALDPESLEAHNSMSDASAHLGLWPSATEHMRAALRISGGSAQAHGNLGAILARQGRLREAVGHLEQAVRLDPRRPEYLANLERARQDERLMRHGRPSR